MISVEPSKIRLMRMSRSICSAGTGFSPRACERLRRLVAAAAADLDHRVDGLPAELGGVELGDRGLDAEVVALVVGQAAGDVDHRLEAERGAGDERELLRDRVVLADRLAPLLALVGPLARDLQRVLRRRRRRSPAATGGRC